MTKIKSEKIGLALGSGGARGLAHIGVLKALEEKNIKVDYISGCSMGALIGGAYAMGMPVAEIERIALQTDWKLMAKILSPTLSTSSFLKDKYLLEFLETYFKGKTFNSLHIPFSSIATDIETGEMVVIEKGYLAPAIRASISIPMIFSPVKFGQSTLVDGGLVNPTPVNIVNEHNVDKIIAVNLMNLGPIKPKITKDVNTQKVLSNSSFKEKLKSFVHLSDNSSNDKKLANSDVNLHYGKILNQMLIIVQAQMAKLTMEIVKPDILIEPHTRAYNFFDFQKGRELIDIGYQTAKAKFNEYNLEVHKNRNLGMLGKDKDKNGK